MEFKFPGFAEAYDASRRDIGRLRGAATTSGNVGPFHKPVAFQHRLCGVLGSFACRSGLLDASAVREPPAEYRRGAGKEGLPVTEQLPQSGVIGAHARPFYLLGSPRPELDSPPRLAGICLSMSARNASAVARARGSGSGVSLASITFSVRMRVCARRTT